MERKKVDKHKYTDHNQTRSQLLSMGQSKDTKEVALEVKKEEKEQAVKEEEPKEEKTVVPEEAESSKKAAVKIKKKRKRSRVSPYNQFKKKMMNSEEIKSIPSKKRFKWVAEQWKLQKAQTKD